MYKLLIFVLLQCALAFQAYAYDVDIVLDPKYMFTKTLSKADQFDMTINAPSLQMTGGTPYPEALIRNGGIAAGATVRIGFVVPPGAEYENFYFAVGDNAGFKWKVFAEDRPYCGNSSSSFCISEGQLAGISQLTGNVFPNNDQSPRDGTYHLDSPNSAARMFYLVLKNGAKPIQFGSIVVNCGIADTEKYNAWYKARIAAGWSGSGIGDSGATVTAPTAVVLTPEQAITKSYLVDSTFPKSGGYASYFSEVKKSGDQLVMVYGGGDTKNAAVPAELATLKSGKNLRMRMLVPPGVDFLGMGLKADSFNGILSNATATNAPLCQSVRVTGCIADVDLVQIDGVTPRVTVYPAVANTSAPVTSKEPKYYYAIISNRSTSDVLLDGIYFQMRVSDATLYNAWRAQRSWAGGKGNEDGIVTSDSSAATSGSSTPSTTSSGTNNTTGGSSTNPSQASNSSTNSAITNAQQQTPATSCSGAGLCLKITEVNGKPYVNGMVMDGKITSIGGIFQSPGETASDVQSLKISFVERTGTDAPFSWQFFNTTEPPPSTDSYIRDYGTVTGTIDGNGKFTLTASGVFVRDMVGGSNELVPRMTTTAISSGQGFEGDHAFVNYYPSNWGIVPAYGFSDSGVSSQMKAKISLSSTNMDFVDVSAFSGTFPINIYVALGWNISKAYSKFFSMEFKDPSSKTGWTAYQSSMTEYPVAQTMPSVMYEGFGMPESSTEVTIWDGEPACTASDQPDYTIDVYVGFGTSTQDMMDSRRYTVKPLTTYKSKKCPVE